MKDVLPCKGKIVLKHMTLSTQGSAPEPVKKPLSPVDTSLPARSSSQTSFRAPPSYDSLAKSPGGSRLGSPLSSRVSSPKGANRFQAFQSDEDEDGQAQEPSRQAASRRPRRANSVERNQAKVLS